MKLTLALSALAVVVAANFGAVAAEPPPVALTAATSPTASDEVLAARAQVSAGDSTRLWRVFAKARRGETITVGVIGGSITAGASASTPERRYGNRVAAWWRERFPRATIEFVNAGIGATGSDYGALRAERDLLAARPDFVVIEYAVNDPNEQRCAETLEGLVRQILTLPNQPAAMLLFTMHNNGANAQEWHSKVGKHYGLPMASFRDALWPEIQAGRLQWKDVEADSVHPNDRGHGYAAQFITSQLENALAALPGDGALPEVKPMAAALFTDLFEHTTLLEAAALRPLANNGWTFDATNQCWKSDQPGSVIEFELSGRAVLTMHQVIRGATGRARVTVDGGPPKELEGWFDQTWGGYRQTREIARELPAGKHRVRFELLAEKSAGSTGHEFWIFGLGAAGVAPQSDTITVASYYFGNYHPGDARNTKLKGKGKDWSEWELIKAAKPRFPGHQQPKVPLWGYGDEADPQVMAQKIAAAADHGVDAFIFDWYYYDDGPFLERPIDEGFLRATNNNRIKFAFMWANHDWNEIQPYKRGKPQQLLFPGKVTPATFDKIGAHVIKDYFLHPSYWRIAGRPYFSFYDLSKLLENFGTVAATRAALDQFRDRARLAGLPGLHLNAVVWGQPILPGEKKPADSVKLVRELGFDSVTSYVWVHHALMPKQQTDYNEMRDSYFAYWDKAEKMFDVPYFPNVTMGWDPSPRANQDDEFGDFGYPFTNTIGENTPARFREALALTKQRLLARKDGPRILNINCWNEWTEGSYLEPDTANGMKYLEAVREIFGPNRSNSVEPGRTR
ncbi:MAG: glycoside hydrolase family 99-like domain-containing protein [Verrucomicrobiota bacterium]